MSLLTMCVPLSSDKLTQSSAQHRHSASVAVKGNASLRSVVMGQECERHVSTADLSSAAGESRWSELLPDLRSFSAPSDV